MSVSEPPKLLLVEDHADTRDAMCLILRRSGFEVTAVSTVAGALAALQTHQCLLLDLMLPDGSGLEVLRCARRDFPEMRTVVLSATADVTVLYEAMELAQHVFLKPIPIHDLLSCLASASAPKS
jgi:CheY-like chemotaxis protein